MEFCVLILDFVFFGGVFVGEIDFIVEFVGFGEIMVFVESDMDYQYVDVEFDFIMILFLMVLMFLCIWIKSYLWSVQGIDVVWFQCVEVVGFCLIGGVFFFEFLVMVLYVDLLVEQVMIIDNEFYELFL